MRISQKNLQTTVNIINHYTKHKVSISFTQGCGVYLTVNGTEYKTKQRGKENCYNGITNKKAYEILKPYSDEAIKIYLEKYEEENQGKGE